MLGNFKSSNSNNLNFEIEFIAYLEKCLNNYSHYLLHVVICFNESKKN